MRLTILLDAMGGDNAPDENIKGAIKAAKEINSQIVLIGNKDIINKKVKQFYGKDKIEDVASNVKIKHTTEQIDMDEIPTVAIKQKKDSSMVVGFKMLKDGEGDVFISAGNSGALLTGATLLVGRIRGVDRPAISPMLPAYGKGKGLMLTDAGANTNCKPINLVQFAQLASLYLNCSKGIESPKVGLLNIGTEETKGNELVKETYKLLKENSKEYGINFVGNIEGRDAFDGEIDIVLTDGFTGNIFLKTIEGMGKFVKKSLIDSLTKNILSIIGTIPCLPAISRFKKMTDYKEYGGALFLGVKKPVVKAHGSSDEYLFYFTIKQAEGFAKSKAVDKMIEEFEKNRIST